MTSASAYVEFDAGADRSAPLTWAHRVMWGPITGFGEAASQFNIPAALPLPAPVPRARLHAALRTLIEDHQTLRTRFAVHDGEPRQLVAGSGRYELRVVGGGGEPVAAAEKLAAELAATAFDYAHEWPLRVGLVLDPAGGVAALALAGSHLALDGWAFNTLCDLLIGSVADGRAAAEAGRPSAGAEEAADDALQPLEQADFQQSEDGERYGRLALRHWEQSLSTAPHSMFDLPASPAGEFPFERHILDSTAVAVAASRLAARARTPFSAVLLGLSALVLTAYNGHDTCVFKLIAGNRLDRRNRGLIAINAQDALLTVPIDRNADLLTAIRGMYRPSFDAYRRAQYDPRALDGVIDRTGLRRGLKFDLTAYFNNGHRGSDWPASERDPTRGELDRMRAQSRYSWAELSTNDMKFYVTASTRGGGVCRLTLMTDTACIPGPVGETMLRGMEKLLCDAVLGEVPVAEIADRLGIVPAVRGADWTRTAAGWLHRDAVARLVSRAAGGAPAAVLPEPGADGGPDRLTAYLAAPELTPDQLHERVLAGLTGTPGTAAPDEYVICEARPADPDPAGWRAAAVLARGPGRDG